MTGRRQENLDALSKELGHERVYTVQWDIADLAGIPPMAETLIKHYGNRLNAVVIVSGLQRTIDFTKPDVSISVATWGFGHCLLTRNC